MVIDVLQRDDLPFPRSLPEFQRMFPNEAACASYLERARWNNGFVCPRCGAIGEPYRISTRPGVLRCRKCRCDTSLMAGTVMEHTHTPLSVWFWAAYLLTSQTPGISTVQFQRQLGLSCYETAFQILHKLRVGMVRPDQDRIGGNPGEHVEADETYVGGRTRGKGRGVHDMALVACAVEVRQRKRNSSERPGVTLVVSGSQLCPTEAPSLWAALSKTPWCREHSLLPMIGSGYSKLGERGFSHTAIAERGDMQVSEAFLPIVHLVFSNLKTWLRGTHHGVSPQHLQAYLNEFTFRVNRRFYPFNSFRSLLGIAGNVTAPTYDELYAAKSRPTTSSGCV